MGRRYEVATIGIDDGLQGFTADPFATSSPSGIGLRIPSFVPNNPRPADNRYLFLLATNRVGKAQRVRLTGWRQYLTLGLSAPGVGVTVPRPVEYEVLTAGWRFPDGNVSWHLVREPDFAVPSQRPATDLVNFAFGDSSTPALLYQTASFAGGVNGGYYTLNMTGYTPPTGRMGVWEPIAGLGNVHDLRANWRNTEAWGAALDSVVEGPCRVSLYASVLQTNPASRIVANNPATPSVGDPPEETFLFKWNGAGGGAEGVGVHYWRVAGALIFEDCDPPPPEWPREPPPVPECALPLRPP
jgi:hypothetical protein